VAVTCDEKVDSRDVGQGDRPTATLKYLVQGTTDEQAALTAVQGGSPGAYNGLARLNWTIAPAGDGSLWEGTVQYGLVTSAPRQAGAATYQFDTGGGQMHITQAKEHIASYGRGGATPPDLLGAIGVTQDSVEGCDVTVPVYNFSETHYFEASVVTDPYKAAIYSLTGKTNSGTFKGFQAGEVLFLGASGSQRQGDGVWEITFRFAASPNMTNLSIGGSSGIAKKGWEYLWVRYEDAEDSGAKSVVKKPKFVFVERVYDAGNFAGLGIG
jgi:hypothetical protein